MPNLLIVDDEQSYRQLLTLIFQDDGHNIRTASNGREAVALLQEEPANLIISDVKMPDMNGIELLRAVREFLPDTAVVLMTAFASVETAREAFKLGADDFIQKPFDVEELKLIVKKALEKQALIDENRAFKRAQRERGSIKNIIGNSDKMKAIFQMIETVAEVQSTVFSNRRIGNGKRTRCARDSRSFAASRKTVYLDQLRRVYRNASRIGTFRLRQRRVHGCEYEPQRSF